MPELKEKLDAGKLNLVAAVQLSYVPEDVQRAVVELDKPISKVVAVKIREEGKTAEDIRIIVLGTEKEKRDDVQLVKIHAEVYEQYFSESKKGYSDKGH